MQRIVIFQQAGNAEAKVRWIGQHGRDLQIVRVVDLPADLPAVIDEPGDLLPLEWQADLVLGYLRHPDLAEHLARVCLQRGVPLVASGKHIPIEGVFQPPTCCGLAHHERLGAYGRQFGAPELRVDLDAAGRIGRIEVERGSPCGSSWQAAEAGLDLPADEAVARYGLEVQLRCQADPAGWDPIHGQSPVHAAGRIHANALKKALG